MNHHWKWACLVVLTLALPACNRYVLNQDFTFDLQSGDQNEIAVNAIPAEQKIKIHVKANGGPVSVFVFLDNDKASARSDINLKKQSDKVLAKVEKSEDVSLDAMIPSNNQALVMVRNDAKKMVNVTLKVTN